VRQARKAWHVAEGHHYHGLRTHFAALAFVKFTVLKTENRRDNRYTEVVNDPDTWEIVLKVDELLSDNQGHGSARRNKHSPASDFSPNCLPGTSSTLLISSACSIALP
jgi:hypothetical protein